MQINMQLVEGFEKLYRKFAEDDMLVQLLDIEGISPDKLDIGKASHNFFEHKLADIATDQNSNVMDVSPTTYRMHLASGFEKLIGYNTLWYYAAKRYGKEFADEAISAIWEGWIYFHDAHGVKIQMPYCYAFSLSNLVFNGRPYGPSPNTAPKHRKSFVSQVDKLISDLSKQFAGATAPSDFFLWYSYFCQLEGFDLSNENHRKEIVQDLQGLTVLFNEPSRAEGESPFVNLGIYDHSGLKALFGHTFYPNGDKADLEYIMGIQKIFCEWFSNGDPISGMPYKFPVVTINITTDQNKKFIDKEFCRWAGEVNRKLGNFNIHFGEEAKLAMCCYSNDTEVLTDGGWKLFDELTGTELFATVNIDTKDIEYQLATHNHAYKHIGIMHHYHDEKRMFDMMVTPNHEMLCVGGTGVGKRDKWKFVKSEEFGSSQALIRRNELYDGECDTFGKLVGFYIGDGYYDTTRHIVSFNLKKQRKISYLLEILNTLNVKHKVGNRDNNGMTRIDILDNTILNVAYEMGKSNNKYVSYNIANTQVNILAGVLDGLMNSDGNWDSNRFWTTSERLRDDVMHIACILGYQPWYTQFDKPVELRGKQYQNNTYEIKLLTVSMLTHARDRRDEVQYDDMVYCVDVPNHTIFTRRNGIASLSSNCRYENDLSEMSMSPDSFGNGGVNIGSHRVVTLSLGKMGFIADGDNDMLIQLIDGYMDIATKLLVVHRYDILESRVKKNPNYLPFFGSLGWFSLDTMFSTYGITGINEMNEAMGYDIITDDGTEFTLDVLSHIKKNAKSATKEFGVAFNIEEIPGEQSCVALAKKDQILHGSTVELYSNQYIPLTKQVDLMTRIDLAGRFMKIVSGGGIVHMNVDRQVDTAEKMYEIFKFAAKSGITHMAICHRFGICTNGHSGIIGQSRECDQCGEPIIKAMNRVIGYYSYEEGWNKTRREIDAPVRHFSHLEVE